jgi:hypothetical protein
VNGGHGGRHRYFARETDMGVEMRFTKWGGKRHWRYPLEPLGTDRYGWWLGGAAGTLLRRGFEEPIRLLCHLESAGPGE